VTPRAALWPLLEIALLFASITVSLFATDRWRASDSRYSTLRDSLASNPAEPAMTTGARTAYVLDRLGIQYVIMTRDSVSGPAIHSPMLRRLP